MSATPSASHFAHADVRPDRSSDAPIAIDSGETASIRVSDGGWLSKIPRSWIGMSGYLAGGVLLGLLLIAALSFTGGDVKTSAGVVTDNVVRLHGRDIGDSCWRGAAKASSAKVTVSLEVGLDGKVRNAVAAGDSPTMRGCVEAYVKAWEFLPQATSSQMVLPVEIDPR
jgi:hypothetical protein